MGHQSHTGYVTTEAYGAAVLFRIDQPEIEESEETLTESTWIGNSTLPPGTVVKRGKIKPSADCRSFDLPDYPLH